MEHCKIVMGVDTYSACKLVMGVDTYSAYKKLEMLNTWMDPVGWSQE